MHPTRAHRHLQSAVRDRAPRYDSQHATQLKALLADIALSRCALVLPLMKQVSHLTSILGSLACALSHFLLELYELGFLSCQPTFVNSRTISLAAFSASKVYCSTFCRFSYQTECADGAVERRIPHRLASRISGLDRAMERAAANSNSLRC